MATINLGNLTFTHKGDYAGGTAYVKNDVVYYATNGNSYIAKTSTTGNAPTSTSHWDLFVAGSSGIWNAGLSLGSAGQIVKVNSSGNALEFGADAGGSILAVSHKSYGGTNSINTQNRTSDFTFTGNSYEISQLTLSMTPSANTSKFLMQMNLQASHTDAHMGMGWITYQVAGGTEYAITSSGTRGITFRYDAQDVATSNAGNMSIAHQVMIAPNTTSAVTFRIRLATPNSTYPWFINRDPNGSTDVDDGGYMLSTFTCYELDGSKSTKGTTTVNETKT